MRFVEPRTLVLAGACALACAAVPRATQAQAIEPADTPPSGAPLTPPGASTRPATPAPGTPAQPGQAPATPGTAPQTTPTTPAAAEPPPAAEATPEVAPPAYTPSSADLATPTSTGDSTAEREAESCGHGRAPGDFMAALFVGAGFFDLSELNDRLADNDFERLTGLMPVLGAEVRAIHPSGLVTGIYGAAILGKHGEGPGALETAWTGGFALLDVGYAPVQLREFTLSLSASVGGYGMTLDIADGSEASFDDVLESPRRGTSLTRGGFAFGLMLRVDGRIPIGAVRNERQGYLALGLRVNGLWGPALGEWSFAATDEDDVDGGPSANLMGAYAALVVGWGSTAVGPTE